MKPTPANAQIDVAGLQALLAEKEAEIAVRDQHIAGFMAQLRGRDFLIEKLRISWPECTVTVLDHPPKPSINLN